MASLFRINETKEYWIFVCLSSAIISFLCTDNYYTGTGFAEMIGRFIALIAIPFILYSIPIFFYWVAKSNITTNQLKWTYIIPWILVAFSSLGGHYSSNEEIIKDSIDRWDLYKKEVVSVCVQNLKQYKAYENFENLDNYCECYFYRIKETFKLKEAEEMIKTLSQDELRDSIAKSINMELCYPVLQMNFYEKNIVKMEKYGGVYIIPIEINGVKKYFILDTGASWIAISRDEAESLYADGKLSESDIVSSQEYETADGRIGEGVKIILRSVKIGNSTIKNVEAIVTAKVNAPLLMGQSALERFGTISIDYNNQILTLEK